jgi:hypothetical protein
MNLQQILERIRVLVTVPWVRTVALTLYYLAILLGLILLYGKGDFSSPPFIYQGF